MNDGDERGERESEAVTEGHYRGNATIMALERDDRDSQGPIPHEHFVMKFRMDGPYKHFVSHKVPEEKTIDLISLDWLDSRYKHKQIREQTSMLIKIYSI